VDTAGDEIVVFGPSRPLSGKDRLRVVIRYLGPVSDSGPAGGLPANLHVAAGT